MTSIAEIKKNIFDYCGGSPERVSILKAVRKPHHYLEVSKKTGVFPTTCSGVLKAMTRYGLVEEVGKRRGIYRQTPDVKGLNIETVVRLGDLDRPGGRVIYKTRNATINLANEFEFANAGFPESVVRDAREMQKIYPYFYLFENSVRYFIINTLEAKHGHDWWELKVSSPIREKAADRQLKEGRNRWHGKRGAHPIFYVDIDDLGKIITANYQDFKSKMPDVKRPIEWMTSRIEEIEMSRNIVAHNNPLSKDDLDRLKVFFKDWVKQTS